MSFNHMSVPDADAVLARRRGEPPEMQSDLARHFQPPVDNRLHLLLRQIAYWNIV